MIVLTETTDTLEAVLGGSVAANQVRCLSSWRDITTSAYTPGRTLINTNNTTSVVVVGAPASSTQRVVDFLNCYNADTAVASAAGLPLRPPRSTRPRAAQAPRRAVGVARRVHRARLQRPALPAPTAICTAAVRVAGAGVAPSRPTRTAGPVGRVARTVAAVVAVGWERTQARAGRAARAGMARATS